MRNVLSIGPLVLGLCAVSAFGVGCTGGASYVRGSEMPGLDHPAMGTGMDKHDIAQALHENLRSLFGAPIAQQWGQTHAMPTLAVSPFINDTTEHIDSQLNALLSDAETELLNSGLVKVVSLERQAQMMAEVGKQNAGGFDPRYMEKSRQLGAKYLLTGKIFASDERVSDARRVQYFMFVQLIEVGSSAVVWQNKSTFTKALVVE